VVYTFSILSWYMSLRDGSPCTDLHFQLFREGHQYDYQNPEGLVDITCVDADGVTPMEEAAQKSNLDVVSVLLSLRTEGSGAS
jgi:ankyrin repeat protein